MPEGWCAIKVGDLARYTNGKAFKPSDWEAKGLPIIRIQNLNDTTCKYNYTSTSHEEKYKIRNGDLLFAWAASLGVYIWEQNDAWLNQHIFKIEPYPFIEKQLLLSGKNRSGSLSSTNTYSYIVCAKRGLSFATV